tara:strand:- start:514 stop:990 length:477 start_codon:yes stop_codon:yes gene_type:complete
MNYIFLLIVLNIFLVFLLYNKKKCNHTGGETDIKTEEEIIEINLDISNKKTRLSMLEEELEDTNINNPLTVQRQTEINKEKKKINTEITILENSLNNSKKENEEYDISNDNLLNINNITTYMKKWCNQHYDTIINNENPDYNDTRMVCRILKETENTN